MSIIFLFLHIFIFYNLNYHYDFAEYCYINDIWSENNSYSIDTKLNQTYNCKQICGNYNPKKFTSKLHSTIIKIILFFL